MPKRIISLIEGNFYHIYNRVEPDKMLFYKEKDYLNFLEILNEIEFTKSCSILAYTLMPNHYHFLVKLNSPDLFSKKMSLLFTKYLNKLRLRENTQGRFFKNRFKTRWIGKLDYLVWLCCYIHRNPLKARLVERIEDWKYSNYLECIGKRNGKLLDRKLFKEIVGTPEEYQEIIKQSFDEKLIEPYKID